MSNLLYCKKCKEYTLNDICKKCNEKTISKYPPRFSPQDRYGNYRRELKKQDKGA
jgi:H/ACA ribonucleoprotein complex subunit 3